MSLCFPPRKHYGRIRQHHLLKQKTPVQGNGRYFAEIIQMENGETFYGKVIPEDEIRPLLKPTLRRGYPSARLLPSQSVQFKGEDSGQGNSRGGPSGRDKNPPKIPRQNNKLPSSHPSRTTTPSKVVMEPKEGPRSKIVPGNRPAPSKTTVKAVVKMREKPDPVKPAQRSRTRSSAFLRTGTETKKSIERRQQRVQELDSKIERLRPRVDRLMKVKSVLLIDVIHSAINQLLIPYEIACYSIALQCNVDKLVGVPRIGWVKGILEVIRNGCGQSPPYHMVKSFIDSSHPPILSLWYLRRIIRVRGRKDINNALLLLSSMGEARMSCNLWIRVWTSVIHMYVSCLNKRFSGMCSGHGTDRKTKMDKCGRCRGITSKYMRELREAWKSPPGVERLRTALKSLFQIERGDSINKMLRQLPERLAYFSFAAAGYVKSRNGISECKDPEANNWEWISVVCNEDYEAPYNPSYVLRDLYLNDGKPHHIRRCIRGAGVVEKSIIFLIANKNPEIATIFKEELGMDNNNVLVEWTTNNDEWIQGPSTTTSLRSVLEAAERCQRVRQYIHSSA